ncbi:hypothetical protein V5N11_012395 [Cardamine amara subsp. amara]|uniref:Uncharacterized protein n=1 Tax=Cardamine amara subsp. amara TaxID=228776 RepID=A0ABD0ZT52_CARAN
MGNCIRHESEMHWAGEDWDEFISEDDHTSKTSREAKTAVSCPSQINRGNEEANHQRLWRPVLQSIPEPDSPLPDCSTDSIALSDSGS